MFSKSRLEAKEGGDVQEVDVAGLLRTAREISTGSVVSDELSDRVSGHKRGKGGDRKRGRSNRRRRKKRTRRLEYVLGFLFGVVIGVWMNVSAAGGNQEVERGHGANDEVGE